MALDLHLATREIDVQSDEVEMLLITRRRRSAQDRAHARRELAWRERFDDVVVGSELEAEHAIRLAVTAGDHDHRERVRESHLREHVEAAHQREIHVEDDQIGRLTGDEIERLHSVAGFEHGKAFTFERDAHERAALLVIVDDENAGVGQCASLMIG